MTTISIPGFSDPISSISHLLTAFMALVGLFFLLVRGQGNSARMTALIIFSISLLFLFSMSGVFHLLDPGTTAREVLQRLDHAGIWVLIAGTFTPIHVILFRGPMRWVILLIVWVVAITGLVLEVVFFKDFPELLSLSLYLGLGWVGAISGVQFTRQYRDQSVRLLLAGGIFYSIGAVIDFCRWPVIIEGILGPHEIFHLLVIAGAASHWFFIYNWCHHPIANIITVNVHILSNKKFIARAIGESLDLQAESLEELKVKIQQHMREKFHQSIQPSIRLRYFEEEFL